MGNGDLVSAWPLLRYVAQRRYASLDDNAAVSFAEQFRFPLLAAYAATLLSVLMILSVALIWDTGI